jgi:hypothetical protein
MKHEEFGKMRKQVIVAATAIVLGIATTATGTIAFALQLRARPLSCDDAC